VKSNNIKKVALYTLIIIVSTLFLIWALLSANGREIHLQQIINGNPELAVIQTGGIRINSNLLNKMTAQIDEQSVDIRENRIENLEPGKHQVHLITEGFNDWYTYIEVKAGIVLDISPLLLPIELNAQALSSTHHRIDKVFYSTHNDFAYYIVKDSEKGTENGIYKLNLSSNQSFFAEEVAPQKVSNILESIQTTIQSEEYTLIPSPDNRKLLFYSNNTGYLIIDTESADINQVPLSIDSLVGYTPEEVYWFEGSSSLIIKHHNLLAEIELSSNRTILIEYNPEHTPIFSVNGDTVLFYSTVLKQLYYYRNENRIKILLENIDLAGEIEELWVDPNTGTYAIYRTDKTYYFLNITDSFQKEIESNIIPINFSKDGSSLLYSKEGSLFSFTVAETYPNGEFITKNNLILKDYNDTDYVQWTASATNIQIVNETTETVQITLSDRTGENIIDILNSKSIVPSSIYVTNDNKDLVLLFNESNEEDNTQNRLYHVSLVQEEK